MIVQIVCRSDKDSTLKQTVEEPFEYTGNEHREVGHVILVPTLDAYHEVQGELLLLNMRAEVICLLPPSTYKVPVGKIPYALVHPDFTAYCEPGESETSYLSTYYFKPKVEKQIIYEDTL